MSFAYTSTTSTMKLSLAATLLLASPALLFAQTPATQQSADDISQAAQQYAAQAKPVVDPRKPAPARAGALTLQQVMDQARTRNPTLLAAAANLRSVRALEIQAAVRQNPTVGLQTSDVTEPENYNNPYSVAVQASRIFERGSKRGNRIDNARATTAQTAAQLEDQIRQTELQVKTAFTNMLFAKQGLDVSTAQLTDFKHEVEIAHDRYMAGDLGKLDFERIDLQLASFESDLATHQIALRQASDQLQTLLGVANPTQDFDVTGDIVPPVIGQTREQLLQAALSNRPDLRAAQVGVEVATTAFHLARANGKSDITGEIEYDRTGTENSLGFGVNLPWRIFDKNQGNIQSTNIAIDTARFQVTAARNQVSSDVDQAWIGYAQAKVLSDRYGQHFLDESSDVLEIARYAFNHGGLTLLDYLDALRDSRNTANDALSAYQQTWLAIHQMSASSATELTP